MYATESILNFSLSLGQLRGVQVRLSLLMFFAMAALMWRLGDLSLGLLACAILLLSVVLHQLAQVFVAQATGNEPSDVVLWPLGGLTTQASEARFPIQLQVQIVGLVVNLVVATICAFQLQHMIGALGSLNPLDVFPNPVVIGASGLLSGVPANTGEPLAVSAVRMIYFANVMLLCVNLLPVIPFDTGRMLRSFLSERYDTIEVNDVMLRMGLVISLMGLVGGFIFDQSSVVALASFVLIIHLHEVGLRSAAHRGYFPATASEDEMDDFSELDSELEGFESYQSQSSASGEDADTDELIARSSMRDRRIARRESERQLREVAERKREEEQVDAILKRIHHDGKESLKPVELQLLKKISQRYRKKSGTHERNTESGR